MNYYPAQFKTSSSSSSSYGGIQEWYITCERAEGIKDKDWFSKSDPYCIIEFGGKRVRTKTIKNDRTPNWNETFKFKIHQNNTSNIKIMLMDDDFGKDDVIGKGELGAIDLPHEGNKDKYVQVPVKRKQQISGVVHLRIKKIDTSISRQPYQDSYSHSLQINQQQWPTNQPQLPSSFNNVPPPYNPNYYSQPQTSFSTPLKPMPSPYQSQQQQPPSMMINQSSHSYQAPPSQSSYTHEYRYDSHIPQQSNGYQTQLSQPQSYPPQSRYQQQQPPPPLQSSYTHEYDSRSPPQQSGYQSQQGQYDYRPSAPQTQPPAGYQSGYQEQHRGEYLNHTQQPPSQYSSSQQPLMPYQNQPSLSYSSQYPSQSQPYSQPPPPQSSYNQYSSIPPGY